mgnify:CR=1 FL=1
MACYDDKGSYNYHDINETTIEGIEGSYNVMRGLSILKIDPKVIMTMANPEDTVRFQYEWRANIGYNSTVVLGTSRELEYPVDLDPNNYTLYFRVIDRETDIATVATASLKVGTPYSRGILLIGENSRGEADVQMLSMSTDTMLCANILENSGLPLLHDPVDIIHTGYNNDDKKIKLWVLTKSQAYSMDRKTFKGKESDNFSKLLYLSQTYESDFVPVDVVPRIKDKSGNVGNSFARAVVCSNGYIFSSSLFLVGGDYYMDPVNYESSKPNVWLKAKPYLLYSLNNYSSLVWYDETNERFMTVSSSFVSSSSALNDVAGDPFPWDQKSLGRTMIYGENTLNTDGGSTNGNSFALLKDENGKYYIYKFYVSSAVSKRDAYTVETSLATDFDRADFYAFSSRRTVIFYAVGSRLYAYDYNKGNEKCYLLQDFGEDQITMLKCDTQIEPSANPIYLATYNATNGGTLRKYIQGTNPDKVEVNPVVGSCWTGLTKIKNMSWRASN